MSWQWWLQVIECDWLINRCAACRWWRTFTADAEICARYVTALASSEYLTWRRYCCSQHRISGDEMSFSVKFAVAVSSVRCELITCLCLCAAIQLLKDKPAGSFVVRNSSSFQGSFGLAVKVAQLPPNVQVKEGLLWMTCCSLDPLILPLHVDVEYMCGYTQQLWNVYTESECVYFWWRQLHVSVYCGVIEVEVIVMNLMLGGDRDAELVRHFLIETTSKGVRLKGCNSEPTFGE